MCLMVPGLVIRRDEVSCDVETAGRIDRVSLALTPEVRVGDWVLVSGGGVARRLDADQAEQMVRAFGLATGQAGLA